MKHVIAGTAGHIDHGKSALVRALTGMDPDRLAEEKLRGITIDIGFAHLDLGEELRVGFIDVPGHERFIKNMLAGASGIDLVLLVVAADESIKPQTREHFDICKLLGVQSGLVVLTKSDLVDPEIIEIVQLEIQEFVAGSFLEGAPIVAVSSRTGAGLNALKAELRRLSLKTAARPRESPFRLPIDRVFIMKGFGVVVTGTLISGTVEREQQVEIYPIGERARVRGIEVHNQAVEIATAGQRTAVNLAGIKANKIVRGMTLAPPRLFAPTTHLYAALTLVSSAPPLKLHAKVHFHTGTSESVAEVILFEGKELPPGGRAYVHLRMAEKSLVLPGDRFIIRQLSPVTTIGGGIVLDNQPLRQRLAVPHAHAFLRVLEHGGPEERLQLIVQQGGDTSVATLVNRMGWQPSEVLRLAKLAECKRRLVIVGNPPSVIVSVADFRALSNQILEKIEQFHKSNPLLPALSREDLRGRMRIRGQGKPRPPSRIVFSAVLDALAAEGKIESHGEEVRRLGHESRLSPDEMSAKTEIIQTFERAGLAVPEAKEVIASLRIDRVRAEKILYTLLKEKTLLKISDDLIFHHAALLKLRETLAEWKTRSPQINIVAFKEITGVSRKYAIPLLEYLDRERVTRREGDARIIL